MEEEVVDAIAVLERPGAVPSTQFEEHDQALHLCEQLQAFNLQLGSAIDEADTVLEISEWDTLTLPVGGCLEELRLFPAAVVPSHRLLLSCQSQRFMTVLPNSPLLLGLLCVSGLWPPAPVPSIPCFC